MKNKFRKWIPSFSIVLPLLFVAMMVYLCSVMQPGPIDSSFESNEPPKVYLNPDEKYYIAGEIECYDSANVTPNSIANWAKADRIVRSFEETKSDNFSSNDICKHAFRFRINIQGNFPCSIILPGDSVYYSVFCNGILCHTIAPETTEKTAYPAPTYVTLPTSGTGVYDVLINAGSLSVPLPSAYGAIILGSRERIQKIQKNSTLASIGTLVLIIFTIIFALIQITGLGIAKTQSAFITFCTSLAFRSLITEDVPIIYYFPHFSLKVGVFMAYISEPLLAVSVIILTFSIYKSIFTKHEFIIALSLQLIPLINGLCLGSFDELTWLSFPAEFISYVICTKVCLTAIYKGAPFANLITSGIILLGCSSLVWLFTRHSPVPAKYVYIFGFLFLSMVEITMLAKHYAQQQGREIFYTEELKRNLEEQQASENAFLNAQMKPHFLYNTLNTIADLCVVDPPKAKYLIGALKEYIKLVLSTDNMQEKVSLEHELKLTSSYIAIESERFPDISFYNSFPDKLPDISIPPLTIQPLVENAIKHGLRKSSAPGAIIITINENADKVFFSVSDTGVGMDKEKIGKMFETPKENKSIGIYNIDKRLKNLYGAGLRVDSTLGSGTTIFFNIPKY